jgi:hypothetical protein
MDANARRNPVFQQALAILNASPLAETVLGKPIHTVGHVHEVAEESGAIGHSAMDIALAGSKGRAMLYVRSSKSDGSWTIEEIALQKEGDPHWVPLQKP